jgi:7SK snRNA methylphosphate capping enzyme
VKKMFKYVFDSLAPGGVFVLEPQPWKSYRQAFRKQKMPEETRAHYRAITLRPSQYAGWLVGPECGCVFVLALDIHCFPSHD